MAVVLETQRHEGRDPRAVPERGLPRAARLVRHPRRGRGGAALLRQGRQQPHRSARRATHRRRHPVAGQPLAVRRRRRARASAATSCCGRWPTPATSRRRPPSAPCSEPLQVAARALDVEAPYFVDFVGQTARREQFPGCAQRAGPLDVYTTLDLHLQRARAGRGARPASPRSTRLLARRKRTGAAAGGAHRRRSAHRRDPGAGRRPLLQPVAVQPRRQRAPPARLGLQAVRLPGGLRAGGRRRPHRRHAGHRSCSTSRRPSRSTERRLDAGQLRRRVRRRDHAAPRAGACRATSPPIKVAEQAGFDTVAALWRRIGVGQDAAARYPSIALGVFEADAARGGRGLHHLRDARQAACRCAPIARIVSGGDGRSPPKPARPSASPRPATTYLVTNMMRSVLNEGTGASARAAGLRARRRRQDRHDQRPARRLVRRLHAGAARRWCGSASTTTRRSGLSGAQAALPIWTAFMKRALAGRAERALPMPPGHRPASRSTATPASWPCRAARAWPPRRSWPAPSRATLVPELPPVSVIIEPAAP